jgi:Sep-tRNA:Cys-tRNA synthetase
MSRSTKLELRAREELFINLEPLQRGGVVPAESRKVALSYIDGYSTCDYCLGTLHILKKPPICDFLSEVADFLGMDRVILTNGCREAKFAIMHAITKPGQAIVVDENKHYTSYVAAERAGLKIYEAPSTSYPEFKIQPEEYVNTIEKVKKETGGLPAVALLTHVDWTYGNLVDAEKVGKICKEYSVPFLLNTAYSSGRMPINGKEMLADFVTCSGHKSWAAGAGVVGILAISDEWTDKVFKPSQRYKVKPIEILGCSARGSSTLVLMTSFPYVKERVKHWSEEVEKTRWFSSQMESLGDIKQLGDKPHNHDLMRFETPILDRIAQKHKRRGYFLYEELLKRKIVGVKAGKTKSFDLSTYGLTKEQLTYVIDSFRDIINKLS